MFSIRLCNFEYFYYATNIQVQSDRYEQICVSPFSWDLDASDLRRQLENGLPAAPSGEKLEVSDVLAVTKDGIWIDGQHFFLMQSQQFGKNAAYVVLDSNGKVAAEDTTVGFTEEVIRQIREYMQRQNAAKEIPARAATTPPLENWQKSYENGEYLRSAEIAEEQNYSMIDGRMNNMPSKGPVHQKPARKRRKGKLPVKGRE